MILIKKAYLRDFTIYISIWKKNIFRWSVKHKNMMIIASMIIKKDCEPKGLTVFRKSII